MFDFLKKKIGGFIEGLSKKEEQKEELPPRDLEPEQAEVPETARPSRKPEPAVPETRKAAPEPREEKPEKLKAPEPKAVQPKARKAVQPKPETAEPEKAEPPRKPAKIQKTPPEIPEPEPVRPETVKQPRPEEKPEEPPETRAPKPESPPAPEPKAKPETEIAKPKPPEPEKPKERVKLGLLGTVKSVITREVEISEGDVKDMLENLELELLEADVEMGVAESIKEDLSSRLIGSRVPKGRLHSFVSESIKETLLDVLTSENAFSIEDRLESAEKPLKIMFIGVNGAGKTTTIAKVARLLQGRGRKVVFAAADTFRAAAIEQMDVHAQRLGVRVIKREYGSDPTSVAYDAVNYAKAHGIDAVLIDTAGRQDTNISLLNEMKKMDRIIQPDLKLYIGEGIAGNAIIEQVSAFHREIGIDGVILTKLDCDPKGGTMLSLSRATGVPIIYVGMGQGYDDLEPFDPESMVARILG